MTEQLGFKGHLTHRGNLRSSRYGWLRLTPMYSVHLVEELLSDDDVLTGGRVLDPFCGTGTTALVCAERGIPCDTTDINPFLLWLTAVKTHRYQDDHLDAAREGADRVAAAISDTARGRKWVPPLAGIEKWWEPPVLDALSRAWSEVLATESEVVTPATWLLTVAFLRVVIKTGNVSFGHQSMSFRQQNGSQLTLEEADNRAAAVAREWEDATSAVFEASLSPILEEPREIRCDARQLTEALERDAYASVITSPPYCNRMSYIRELRPYMYWMGFLGDARAAAELDWLAIGGTWGVATSRVGKWEAPPGSAVPFEGFEELTRRVATGEGRSGDLLARYISKYFYDATLHSRELFEVVEPGGHIHYIVGNSKFYDVLIPVERIYASIFESVGFEDAQVTTLRKRSSKKELFEYLVSARKP